MCGNDTLAQCVKALFSVACFVSDGYLGDVNGALIEAGCANMHARIC